ncbi:MAG: hypothetical protein IKX70_02100 [Treponema sp.]|nr:hypothetical protein [Treponema sp.]
MNENKPCVELNEIIYRISGEFWKQAYNLILRNQKDYKSDSEISRDEAISEFRNGIIKLSKEKRLKCNAFSHNEHYYMSLTPYPIYIGIEKETGDFAISAPHISTKQFKHSEYKRGIKWIEDYLNIDIKPLAKNTEAARERFYINEKSSEIANTSIAALCESLLAKRGFSYKLHCKRLSSQIRIFIKKEEVYEIMLYLNPFLKDPSVLTALLNNPHEMKIDDVLSCGLIEDKEEFEETAV